MVKEAFPTLNTLLTQLPEELGCFIEIKYPNERYQAQERFQYPSRNVVVDVVLTAVLSAHLDRTVIFISFDADVCHLLSTKQNWFPVMHLTGLGDDSWHNDPDVNVADLRNVSIEGSIEFASSHNLFGVVTDAKTVLNGPFGCKARARGLHHFTYGREK